MEKMYSKSEINPMLEKAILNGKISAAEFHLRYIDTLLEKNNAWQKHFEEKNIFMSEEWFECEGQLKILSEIRNYFLQAIKLGIQKQKSK